MLVLSFSSDAKAAPKLGANETRIVLEQSGQMGDPRFSKMMLVSREFNGAAQDLTDKKNSFFVF